VSAGEGLVMQSRSAIKTTALLSKDAQGAFDHACLPWNALCSACLTLT
jgi:hypothetical protein